MTWPQNHKISYSGICFISRKIIGNLSQDSQHLFDRKMIVNLPFQRYTKRNVTSPFGIIKSRKRINGGGQMDLRKNDLTEQEELKILGEILEAYIDTPIEKDAFLISDLGLDSFLIVYFISEVDDRFGVTIEMPEHVEYMTVQDVLDQLNHKN